MNFLQNRLVIMLLTVVGFLIVFLSLSLFVVTQTEQGLVLQLGDPVRTIHNPGLHMKIPVIQNVIFYDNRLLDVDLSPEEVIAADQKRLVVDTFLRYRITDPLLFYKTLGAESVAQTRLQTLAGASLRRVLGSYPLSSLLSPERTKIMTQIKSEVSKMAEPFGVDVVDVRIRHADLPKANSEAIYLRMESERKREAKEFRAKGEEIAKKIRSYADRDRTILLAEAKNKAQALRGEGDGSSIRIMAEAFSKDQKFFEFYRSLEAYKNSFKGESTTFVISPTGKFFKFFNAGTSQ
ncbi:MAG: protease modulator HflC [Alphaproteobacteria bacterium 16-39-46]|nr:MAG: protease modulator HflC [Alphaproteobacteria bacterium 16-39-46]OZA42351.1 MAG: protease modulator HflC [Alphaproteobacteria bacterium 17-39-52]HQS84515.1 protease modulator HflC [Alphaproteobacteria bacterium]HQS94297.1 protease modulator HflC [Alphaproteobacteria bacterium]